MSRRVDENGWPLGEDAADDPSDRVINLGREPRSPADVFRKPPSFSSDEVPEAPEPTHMTPIDLPAIRARVEAATKGPWIADMEEPYRYTKTLRGGGKEECVSAARCHGIRKADHDWDAGDDEIVTTDSGHYGPRGADARFIAASRSDVPALLELVDTLTMALAMAYAAFTDISGYHESKRVMSEALDAAGLDTAESRDAARARMREEKA